MSIWVCYTEVGSEPSFHGYVRSKKEAIEWVKDTYPYHFNNGDKRVATEDYKDQNESEHFAIAVKVEAME